MCLGMSRHILDEKLDSQGKKNPFPAIRTLCLLNIFPNLFAWETFGTCYLNIITKNFGSPFCIGEGSFFRPLQDLRWFEGSVKGDKSERPKKSISNTTETKECEGYHGCCYYCGLFGWPKCEINTQLISLSRISFWKLVQFQMTKKTQNSISLRP